MIVLVGFMAAGKSTVGRLLAERMGLPFLDSDQVLVERLGMSIADHFAAHGELAFRAAERDTVLELLAGAPCVLALGGGSLGSQEVRDALVGHDVVHLDVPLDEALTRVGDGRSRPMLSTTDVPRLYADRQPVYAAAATLAVATGGHSPAEVADEVVHRLPRRNRPDVVLVGPPGAGKSAVGRLVADRLGEPCVETDRLVEQRAGLPVAEVFVDLGESRFRELERAATLEALAGPGVVEVGGGAITDPEIRAALAHHPVVFLDVGIADAAKRIGFDSSSMVALLPRRSWIKHMEARRPLYVEAATWTVDTAGRSVQDVADQVVELLQGGSA